MAIRNGKKYVTAVQNLGNLKKGKQYELVRNSANRYTIIMDGWTVSYLKVLFTY